MPMVSVSHSAWWSSVVWSFRSTERVMVSWQKAHRGLTFHSHDVLFDRLSFHPPRRAKPCAADAASFEAMLKVAQVSVGLYGTQIGAAQ